MQVHQHGGAFPQKALRQAQVGHQQVQAQPLPADGIPDQLGRVRLGQRVSQAVQPPAALAAEVRHFLPGQVHKNGEKRGLHVLDQMVGQGAVPPQHQLVAQLQAPGHHGLARAAAHGLVRVGAVAHGGQLLRVRLPPVQKLVDLLAQHTQIGKAAVSVVVLGVIQPHNGGQHPLFAHLPAQIAVGVPVGGALPALRPLHQHGHVQPGPVVQAGDEPGHGRVTAQVLFLRAVLVHPSGQAAVHIPAAPEARRGHAGHKIHIQPQHRTSLPAEHQGIPLAVLCQLHPAAGQRPQVRPDGLAHQLRRLVVLLRVHQRPQFLIFLAQLLPGRGRGRLQRIPAFLLPVGAVAGQVHLQIAVILQLGAVSPVVQTAGAGVFHQLQQPRVVFLPAEQVRRHRVHMPGLQPHGHGLLLVCHKIRGQAVFAAQTHHFHLDALAAEACPQVFHRPGFPGQKAIVLFFIIKGPDLFHAVPSLPFALHFLREFKVQCTMFSPVCHRPGCKTPGNVYSNCAHL